MNKSQIGPSLVACVLLLTGCPDSSEPPPALAPYRAPVPNVDPGARVPLEQAPVGQLVYVPVYSHIYVSEGRPHRLEATLSVRNTDPHERVTINTVDYYDSAGVRTRRLLDAPLALGPLATSEFVIPSSDTGGGAGANFIVEWVAAGPVVAPMIESVMTSQSGTFGIGFARPGRVIVDRR